MEMKTYFTIHIQSKWPLGRTRQPKVSVDLAPSYIYLDSKPLGLKNCRDEDAVWAAAKHTPNPDL